MSTPNTMPPPPPGYSASDLQSSPTASSAMPPPPPGYSADDLVQNTGASTPSAQSSQPSQPSTPAGPGVIDVGNPSDSVGTTAAKGVAAVGAGVGQGLLHTLNGAADLFHLPHATLQDREQELKQDNAGNPTLNTIGYGGETLMEFMLGDSALQALPLAKKLAIAAKTAKAVEGSPLVMRALQVGAGVLKKSALSGGETALVQGAQTLARTGGDVKQAGEDAAGAGLAGGVLGGATGTLGEMLGKGAQAANTVKEFGQQADNAVSEQGLSSSLADTLNQEKAKIDSAFEGEKQAAEGNLSQQTEAANADRTQAQQTADEQLASRKDQGQDLASHQAETAQNKLGGRQYVAQTGLDKAKQVIQQTLVGALDNASAGAADTKDLASTVNEGINQAEQASHTAFEQGITGENGIVNRLKGQSIPFAGSPVSAKASDLLNNPNPEDHPIVQLAMEGRGETLSPKVQNLLDGLSNGQIITKAGKGAKAVETATPLRDLTAQDLVRLRQTVRGWASDATRGDPDSRVLYKLLPSIDDTLGKLADKSGDAGVMADYGNLRNNYRIARANLDSTTAEKLNLDKPDQALNDVNKYLLSGANSSAKIKTLGNVIGPDAMQGIAKSKVQQWKTLAEQNPDQFVKEWNKIPSDVRSTFFGSDLTKTLQDAADTYSQSSTYAENYAKLYGQAAKAENKAATAGAKQLGKSWSEGVTGAYKAATEAIGSKYTDAVSSAQEAYDNAIASAKGTHATASEPFSGSFMKNLAEGRVNDSLLKGDVDVQDIRNVKQAVGSTKWNDIANGIWQRAVADSSTGPVGASRFDPSKFMEWWNGIKPDVRTEMLNMNDPAFASKYQDAVSRIQGAARTKLVSKGLLYPTTALSAAALGATVGGGLVGPAGEVIGALAGLGGSGIGLVREFVNSAANSPTMWKALEKAGQMANSPAAKAAATAVKGAAGQGVSKLRQSLNGATSLGQ